MMISQQVVSFPPQPVDHGGQLVVNIRPVIYFQVTGRDEGGPSYEIQNYIQAIEEAHESRRFFANVIGGMRSSKGP